jgi:hypothetical protein
LSLGLVVIVIVLGGVIGLTLNWLFGAASPRTTRSFQYLGIGVLLWATLAKGGWNLQTPGGDTLAELVDQWLYRILYCLGSLLLVISETWSVAFG